MDLTKTIAEIKERIDRANSVLLHCHPKPDADSMGSALAMKSALEQLGKKTTVIKGDSDLPLFLQSLPGYDTIIPQTFGETDLSQFDLFIILDSAHQHMITNRTEVVFPEHLATIVIDHHHSTEPFADINLIDTSAPATAQILFYLFKGWGITITQDIASCLFAGIYTDTGGFQFPRTSALTFEAAAELARVNPHFTEIIFNILNSNSEAQVRFYGLAYNSIKTFFNNSVAVSLVRYEAIETHGLFENSIFTSDISTMLRTVPDWKIGIAFIEVEPNVIKISLRSRGDEYDVSKIASFLGGGGHKQAAGIFVKGAFDEIKEKLLSAIKEGCPQLAQ